MELDRFGSVKAGEKGLRGRIYTIKSVVREFRKGNGDWDALKRKYNITVLPDPPRSDRGYKNAKKYNYKNTGKKGLTEVDARVAAAAKRYQMPLATGDDDLAQRARVMGVTVRKSKSRFTKPGQSRNVVPPTPLRVAPPPKTPTPLLKRKKHKSVILSRKRTAFKFISRIGVAFKIAGGLFRFFGAVNTVHDAMTILASGTIFPEAQRTARLVEKQSVNAESLSIEVFVATPLLTYRIDVDNVIKNENIHELTALAAHIGDLEQAYSDKANDFKKLSEKIRARVEYINEVEKLAEKLFELGSVDGAMVYISIPKLRGPLKTAADNYEKAYHNLDYAGKFMGGLLYIIQKTGLRLFIKELTK